MFDLLPDGPERNAAIARLATLEGRQQEIENNINALSAEIERVRLRVKPQMKALNEALSPIIQEIDELRLRLFPRMGIGG